MKNILITLVLILASTLFGQNLWKYANAGADAIVYINSESAEKNMDPELWRKIQREKKEAIAVDERRLEEAKEYEAQKRAEENAKKDDKDKVEDDDDGNELKLNLKDRHMQLLVNIFVLSNNPMVTNFEGALILKGNDNESSPLQDFKKLLDDQKDNSAVSQRKVKVDGREAYAIDTSANVKGANTPVNCLVIPRDDHTFEFKMMMNSQDGIMPAMLPQLGGPMAMTEGIASGDNAIAVGCNTQKLASMMNGELSPQMMGLKNCLQQTDIGKMTCRVSGKDAYITLMLHFYDATVAQRILMQIQQFVTTLNTQPVIKQYLRDVMATVNADQLVISATVDVETGWAIVRKFHR
ncbi:MAG: hypothetical protein IJS15_06765 [Victivallales bacterium]|nr:hypothetical protein [Victivallales bacterium]